MEDFAATDLVQRRFSGLDRLFGVASAARVRKAHVAVVGIGGVGSWAAEALARSGVEQLTLVDLDHISESNINRQIHAVESTVGMAKIDAMANRIASINPYCVVNRVDDFASKDNWQDMLPASVDGVIDACDQVQAKVAMATWAVRNRRLFVCVGAAGGKTHAHRVDVGDLSKTTNDPLLASLRYQLRKAGVAPKGGTTIGLPCVFSTEQVKRPDVSCAIVEGVDGSLNCHGYGSLVTVTATFGLVSAGWMMDKLSKSRIEQKTRYNSSLSES